jgi:endoglucanase
LAPAVGAYTSDQPTSQDNPIAGRPWFVDWQWGMSQRQFLEYVTHGHQSRVDRLLYGNKVIHVRQDERNALKRRMWSIMARTDPSSLIPRAHERDRGKARLILKIARNPQTKRYGGWTRHPQHEIRSYLRRLRRAQPGSYAFFYVYRIRHNGCAHRERRRDGPITPGFDAGGYRDARAYRRWIRRFARGLGQAPAAVFLEPDALGVIECLPRRFRRLRYSLLRYAIRKLQHDRNVAIYLDAGAADWKLPVRLMARRLQLAGVGRVRGFFLNSTHYDFTRNNLRYGDRLSRALGGKHYVISTAVNGRGPYRLHRRKRYFNELRCNPPGRALGDEPTVRTSSIWADAYVWIGDPGRSGGNCPHPGQKPAPPAGSWWEQYALGLAKRAVWP